MQFTTEYTKLQKSVFTTIRKNTGAYELGTTASVTTPKQVFRVKVIGRKPMKKADITEELAKSDADCTSAELIAKLERWYGKEYDTFVLLTLEKCGK